MTCADLDADGDQDLACADFAAGVVSVLINLGNGSFAGHVQYAVGTAPTSVLAADFDGDGDQDLATANYGSDTVSVLFNQGNGTFATQVQYPVGSMPFSVTCADLDGDGDQDLAAANNSYSNPYSSSVSVLLNQGNGTFATHVQYACGDEPLGLTHADLDGDGDQDLAIAAFGGDRLSVLLNQGNGTFAGLAQYFVGYEPYWVTSADFDGDGDQDLAGTRNAPPLVWVAFNQGNGTFSTQVPVYYGGNWPRVIGADLDGDGDEDLVSADFGSGNVAVLLNQGNGTFVSSSWPLGGSGPFDVASADLDGDGDPDLVSVNYSSNTVSVLLNQGNACGTLLAFCDSGSGVGVTCPCGNNGAPGNGCANSAYTAGANLAGAGSPSVLADTLVLNATAMTGSTCVFFQGNGTMAPVVVGDGLGCVTGTVVRLGTKTIASGQSNFPQVGDPLISVRGAIPSLGGTYYYQCFYRNAAATFCPPGTSNRTNGIAVTWTP